MMKQSRPDTLSVVFEQQDTNRYEVTKLANANMNLKALCLSLTLNIKLIGKTFNLHYLSQNGSHVQLRTEEDFQTMCYAFKKPFCHIYGSSVQNTIDNESESLRRKITFLTEELDQSHRKFSHAKMAIHELEDRVSTLQRQLRTAKNSHNNVYLCDPPEMDRAMSFVLRVKKRLLKDPERFRCFVKAATMQSKSELAKILHPFPDLLAESSQFLNIPTGHPRTSLPEQGVHQVLQSLGYRDELLNNHLIKNFDGNLNTIIPMLQAFHNFPTEKK